MARKKKKKKKERECCLLCNLDFILTIHSFCPGAVAESSYHTFTVVVEIEGNLEKGISRLFVHFCCK